MLMRFNRGYRQKAALILLAAGVTAIYEGNLMQRHFQDIHVITQHMQGRLQHYEMIGQYWLGMPVDETRF